MTNHWLNKSACDLGRAIEKAETSSLELTKAFLEAAEKHRFRDKIFARLTQERALEEARKSDQRTAAGNRLSLLDGVPISWKDLFDTKAIITEAGSQLLKNRVPLEDAEVLKNATQAGLVCLGKTHMSELAFSGLGLNPMTATTPCVNDFDAVSGGSSSGAAGSVAFGLSAAGIGSDTGGSVRAPSAWNDLVGLKTTSGQLSLKGVVPLCKSYDTVGPLCRTVEDAAALFAIMKGEVLKPIAEKSARDLKLLSLVSLAQDDLEELPRTTFEENLMALKNAGATVDKLEFETVFELIKMAGVLFTTEAFSQWENELRSEGHKMYPEIYQRFMSGSNYSQQDLETALARLEEIKKEWNQATHGYDAVILPSSAIMPPKLEKLMNDGEYYKNANLLALRNTRIGNLLGLCSLTLPTKSPSVGFMLFAAANSEEKLLCDGNAIAAIL